MIEAGAALTKTIFYAVKLRQKAIGLAVAEIVVELLEEETDYVMPASPLHLPIPKFGAKIEAPKV